MNRRKAGLVVVAVVVAAGLVIMFSRKKMIPEGAIAVKPFDISKYLGRWYEIARFDFKYEKNLNQTTAEYSKNDDGSIRVVNRGYNTKTKEWKLAEGTAKFRGQQDEGSLKVSFFGPFYSGYNVVAIDENYQYALVAGESLDYLWILSRTGSIPESVKQSYLRQAESVGYDVSRFVWVEHSTKGANEP